MKKDGKFIAACASCGAVIVIMLTLIVLHLTGVLRLTDKRPAAAGTSSEQTAEKSDETDASANGNVVTTVVITGSAETETVTAPVLTAAATTAAPVVTTAVPAVTTAAPVVTTTAPVVTTTAPPATATAPAATTAPTVPGSHMSYTEMLENACASNDPKKSGGSRIRDFDNDGLPELITVVYDTDSAGWLTGYTVQYYRIENGAAVLKDSCKVNNSRFEGLFFLSGWDDAYTGEGLQVCVNDDGYVLCNYYTRVDNISVSYLLLSLQNKKLVITKHLWDPGYTSGLGIYTYDGYHSRSGDLGVLFSTDYTNETHGKYSSYKTALEKEIGVYGFTFAAFSDSFYSKNSMMKCEAVPSDTVTELLYVTRNMP